MEEETAKVDKAGSFLSDYSLRLVPDIPISTIMIMTTFKVVNFKSTDVLP